MLKYFVGYPLRLKNILRLGALENVPRLAWMTNKGERQKGNFPTNAFFRPSHNFSKTYNKLADCLSNLNRLLVVSEKFRDVLSSAGALEQNDVYPVIIYNHAQKPILEKYFIVHQYNYLPCVDEKKTIGVKSSIDKAQYVSVDKLVLNEKKIDAKRGIFRTVQYTDYPFFRSDVVEKIKEAGITGIGFSKIDEFDDY
jgi:hypothetical protein